MLKGIITAALLCVQCALFSADYSLAICTMFKNEARWLREWVEYHRLLGVEHFYLYDNESTDDSLAVLQPYVQQGLVDVIPWKNVHEHWDPRGGTFDSYQIKAFNDCIDRTVGVVSWLAVINIDEYLVPVGQNDLKKILNAADAKVGSLYLNWTVFGTSFVWELPEDQLLTATMVLRAPDYHPWNKLTKCIHRPEAVSDCLVHSAQLNSGYEIKTIDPSEARINNYWTLDEKSLLQKRFGLSFKFRPRNLRNRLPKDRCDQILTIIQDLDRFRDETPIPNLAALKQAMGEQPRNDQKNLNGNQESSKEVGQES